MAKNPFPYIGAFLVGVVSNVIANKISDKIKLGKETVVTGIQNNNVINSNDLRGMEFETLRLKSPYLELIGDPSKNFKAMVFGEPKGGKSTFCINFAKFLAENHGKVLYCGIEEQVGYTIKEKFDRLNAYHQNLDIAEAIPDNLSSYDFIFIDCPPSLGLLTLNSFTCAQTVLIPIQCEYYALEGVSQLTKTIKHIKKNLNPALDIEGVLLTMLDARTNLGLQVVEEVKRFLPGKVYAVIIPRNVRLSEAPSFGQPITVYDRASRGAETYTALAEEFISLQEAGHTAE